MLNKKFFRFLIIFAAFFVVSLSQADDVSSEFPPASNYAQIPEIENVRLSPDGSKLLFINNVGDQSILRVISLDERKSYNVIRTDNSRYRFNWASWANNETVLLSTLFPMSEFGVRYMQTRLAYMKFDGSAEPNFVSNTSVKGKSSTFNIAQSGDQVADLLPDNPDEILINLAIDMPMYSSLYRYNLKKGSKRRVQRARSGIYRWYTDTQHNVRVGEGFEESTGESYWRVFDVKSKSWREAWRYTSFSGEYVYPLGFGIDPNILYVRASHQGKRAIFTVDVSDPELTLVLKAHDDKRDILGGLIRSPKSGDVVGVYHSENEDGRIYWNEEAKLFNDSLNKVLPDTSNYIVSFDKEENRYVLFSGNDTQPGKYYLGDRSKKTLDPIFNLYESIDKDLLSISQYKTYKARDGLEIEAVLNLPKNSEGKSLPTVIFPHGGPISRSTGGFDSWVAFFNSRGIAVLQPNFRGSTGYGDEFSFEAVQNYGLAMQDDLTDAANWLVENKISDKNKMCIVGGSCGGYAALMATVKTPDMFQCAISIAGVSDLNAQRNSHRGFSNYTVAKQQYGMDKDQLRDTSPLYSAEKITTPILLLHGELDRIVKVEQSREMAEALEKAGKTYQYVELEAGSHNLHRQVNRTRVFEEMDKFLQTHLLH